jgi:hypothetical protein
MTVMVIGPRQIVVELEPGPPMRGRVHTAPGFDQPFTGWISLLGALESAIGEPAVDDQPRAASPRRLERSNG